MKREGETAMKCYSVNKIGSKKHDYLKRTSSAIIDFDKQQRNIVNKIDDMGRQIYESLRELRDLLSRSRTTHEQIMQADVILEQVKQDQIHLHGFIFNIKNSQSIFTGVKQQNGFVLKPTNAPLFASRVTINPILKEHNLKQQKQRLQSLLFQDKAALLNVPTLGSLNDQTVPRSDNELRTSNVRIIESDLSDIMQPQPTPLSRRIVNNFPMTTPPLQTQNEKDAINILQKIGKFYVFCE